MRHLYWAVLVALLLTAVVYHSADTLRINWIVWLTVARGILTVNPLWWRVNDWYADSTGVGLYQRLQRTAPFVPTNIFGTRVVIVTDITAIREILDASPVLFGVGLLKRRFFSSFMAANVGVSEGCPWRRRRAVNDHVLTAMVPDVQLPALCHFPTDYAAFRKHGREIATRIVFGAGAPVCNALFNIFDEANSMWAVVGAGDPVTPQTRATYTAYLRRYIAHPVPGSLVALARQMECDATELEHQIPHWVFPLNGLLTVSAPRLLVLLLAHPDKLARAREQQPQYMRACILELLRLNNPVNSTFRTLLARYTFREGTTFDAGTQFLVLNNPVSRDPAGFVAPNQFVPERWTPDLEASYYALMFNQGPQQCPGKELAIRVLSEFMRQLLAWPGSITTNTTVDPDYIPQMLNPTTIQFSV